MMYEIMNFVRLLRKRKFPPFLQSEIASSDGNYFFTITALVEVVGYVVTKFDCVLVFSKAKDVATEAESSQHNVAHRARRLKT
jgi:hypothetical protein